MLAVKAFATDKRFLLVDIGHRGFEGSRWREGSLEHCHAHPSKGLPPVTSVEETAWRELS
jgi:hypothetical protein